MRRLPDGCVSRHHGPAMVQQFSHHLKDYELGEAWDSLELPLQCPRGEGPELPTAGAGEAIRTRSPAR